MIARTASIVEQALAYEKVRGILAKVRQSRLKLPKHLRGLGLRALTFKPRTAYVYILTRRGEVVYVGSSANIWQRIGDHIGSKNFDRVHLMPIPKKEMLFVEAALIHFFKPTLNQQFPTVGMRQGEQHGA